jgi:tetratricopeptide (TPR) repeat protein
MTGRLLTAIAIGLGLIAAPACAETKVADTKTVIQTSSSSQEDIATIDRASGLVARKQSVQALDLLAPVLARFDAQIAAAESKGMVFCGPSMIEAILYSTLSASQKKDGLVLGPEVCNALLAKAYALTDLDRKEEALATLQRLTALAPMHGYYFVELGYSYRVNGQNDKALEAYQTALQHAEFAENDAAKKRVRAAARRGIGYMLVEKGDLDGAEKSYKQSLKDDPDSMIAKSELTFIAQQRKK